MRSRGRRSSGSPRGEEYESSPVRLRCEAAVAAEKQGVWVSRGMAWPAVGVVRGGEASAASQPATRGRSTRHDRRCFGWLEQEDQRLKKHYGRWMDIVRSLELESCILTKLTKPSIPVNLIGPQLGFGREHIAHLRFVRMYIPFFNSNGIYYSPFTVC